MVPGGILVVLSNDIHGLSDRPRPYEYINDIHHHPPFQ